MTAWRNVTLDNKGKIRIPEHDIQSTFIGWCEANEHVYPALRWIHAIPNGAKLPYYKDNNDERRCKQAAYLKAEGLKSGILDVHLPVARGGYHSIYIEFKAGNNDLTDTQRQFWEFAVREGNYCCLCKSFEDAKSEIVAYLEDFTERTCRVCGCTDVAPCEDGCYWVYGDLCSSCSRREE